jgi:regulator of sigma E protease
MFFDGQDRSLTLPDNPLIGRKPCRLIAVNSHPVSTLTEVRSRMQQAVAVSAGGENLVELRALPIGETDPAAAVTIQLPIDAKGAAMLANLSWSSPFGTVPFEPLQTTLKASNPLEAVRMGIAETRRVMTMTYLTFARLFEGTVKVQHLKGPVGIAHFGTMVADRGWVWLLFFFALISVNLAVVNFLPLPIVDGGQFLLIMYEQIRGRPAPIAFQNAAMIAGLILIGISFLFITVNDIRNLFGP